MAYPTATLNGLPLLAIGEIAWAQTSGFTPVIQVFHLSAEDAAAVLGGDRTGATLVLTDNKGNSSTSGGLHVLGPAMPATPFTGAVRVADVRYLLPRILISRRYNVTRRTANSAVRGWNSVNLVKKLKIRYEEKSLNNGSRWVPKDMLGDVAREIAGRLGITINVKAANYAQAELADNIVLEGNAVDVLKRVMRYMPELELASDASGSLRVINMTDAEAQGTEIAKLPHSVIGGGLTYTSDNSFIAPAYIDVLFPREMEVRFDFNSVVDTVSDVHETTEDRLLQNVWQNPRVKHTVGSNEYGPGAFVPYTKAALAPLGSPGGSLPSVNDAVIRKFYWGNLLSTIYGQAGILNPTKDWPAISSSLLKNYRLTFRLPRSWVDAASTMLARTTSLIDPTTRLHSPSPVWMPYSLIPSMRGRVYMAQTDAPSYLVNVPAKTSTAFGNINLATSSAPATLSIVDASAGIVRFDMGQDPLRLADTRTPGVFDGAPAVILDGGSGPFRHDAPLTQADLTILNTDGTGTFATLGLKFAHLASTLLTMTPNYPNNNAKYHVMRITAKDVKEFYGIDLPVATGPGADFKVNFMTARFAWDDNFAQTIEEGMGLGLASQEPTALAKALEPIIVTDDHRNELEEVATAAAAAIYLALVDRVAGSRTDRLNSDIKIEGAISSIRHTLSEAGAALTRVTADDHTPVVSPISWLSPGVQRVVNALMGRTQ